MALDLALGRKSHDLALDPGDDFVLIANAERVAQMIKITLLAFLGEWFLDTAFGTPYFEHILVKGPDRGVIESVLRAQIASVPGVQSVPSLTLQTDAVLRRLQVTFVADTWLGQVNQSVMLNG